MDPIDVVKAEDSTTLKVEFTPVAGATGYIIRIENNAGFFREDHVTSSPAQLGSLEPYTAYSLSIISKNADGRSQPSTSVEGKTGALCRFKNIFYGQGGHNVGNNLLRACFKQKCVTRSLGKK